MRTASVSKIKRMKIIVSVVGVLGVIGGLFGPVWVFFTSIVLWWIAASLVNKRWEYAGDDTYIMDGSRVHLHVEEACWVARKDLPKGFEIIRVCGQVEGVFDLFVVNLVHGGFIIPLEVAITLVVERSNEGVENYTRHFKWGSQLPSEYLHYCLKKFKKEQEDTTGVFGYVHALQAGFPEWIELVLKPSLEVFLAPELATHGLRVTDIEVIPKERQKSVVQLRASRRRNILAAS